jgi:integrase
MGRTGLVFPAPEGGYIRRSNFTRRARRPACKVAVVDGLRFHDLRHSHAVMAASTGIDLPTLMSRGWAMRRRGRRRAISARGATSPLPRP